MVVPRSVEIFATGVLNGSCFVAEGALEVDADTGTKSGTIAYESLPAALDVGIASLMTMTGRCFVGAKHVGSRPFVGPLELLGREFVSLRTTTVGRYGSASVSERARFVGTSLRCELSTLSRLRSPAVIGAGPLREVISVCAPDTLIAEGHYSHRPARGRPIPVRYSQFYRSLRPDRGLFRRLNGRRYLLRVKFSSKVSGRKLVHHTQSTVRQMPAS
jgi:hypothetical protein